MSHTDLLDPSSEPLPIVNTRWLNVDPTAPTPGAINVAAQTIRRGGLVAFPTETVYGLGANALDAGAVRRIFAAKRRPALDPLIVHVLAIEDLAPLVAPLTDQAHMLIAHFWPGPLTLVLNRTSTVPNEVSAGGPTVAVRSPAHAVARALIQAAGTPIAAPSANLFGHTSPTTAQHVWDDLQARIDLILDGGPTTIGVESTVIDLTGVSPVILRPGGISQEALCEVLGDVALRTSLAHDGTLASPGMLDRHYAPRTPFLLTTGDDAAARRGLFAAIQEQAELGRLTAVLAYDEDLAELEQLNCLVSPLGSIHEPDAVAARLYAALRAADNMGVDLLLARDLPAHGIGLAIRDRLRRAARTVVTVT